MTDLRRVVTTAAAMLGLLLYAVGCATVPHQSRDITGYHMVSSGKTVDMNERKQLHAANREILAEKYGHEWRFNRHADKRQGPPRIGLAISGGGARSASFSIGVLKALSENRILDEVDVISAVSGGAWATYWYYSQNCYFNRSANQIFCPQKDDSDESTVKQSITAFKPHDIFLTAEDANDAGRPGTKQNNLTTADAYRFQHILEESSDILTYSKKSGISKTLVNVAQQTLNLGTQILSVPFHWIGNGLFDWELNINPYRKYYQNGLERTYGYAPLSYDFKHFLNDQTAIFAKRAYAMPVSFSDIELYIERKRDDGAALPYFIINTTGGYGRAFNKFGVGDGKRTMRNAVFEFTPWQYGSDLFGYWPLDDGPPDLTLSRVVSISGAAVDGQYESIDVDGNSHGGSVPLASALNIFNLDLGYHIPNPATPGPVRLLHKIAPFPLYIGLDYMQDDKSSSIYLSDGGHAENLGAFSLIRRGVQKIIIVDAEADQDTTFSSAKKLQHSLRDELHLELAFDQDKPIDVYDTHLDDAVFKGTITGLVDAEGNDAVIDVYYLKLSIDRCLLQAPGQSEAGRYPFAVSRFREVDKAFPHNSTADVFFSPQQFQAYRALGYTMGQKLDKKFGSEIKPGSLAGNYR